MSSATKTARTGATTAPATTAPALTARKRAQVIAAIHRSEKLVDIAARLNVDENAIAALIREGAAKDMTAPKTTKTTAPVVTTAPAPKTRAPRSTTKTTAPAPAPASTAPKTRAPKTTAPAPAPAAAPKTTARTTKTTAPAAPAPKTTKTTKTAPAPKTTAPALKTRKTGPGPYRADTAYENARPVDIRKNAAPASTWERGAKDWNAAPYRLAVYTKSTTKVHELVWPSNVYYRTVGFDTVEDAAGYVDAIVKVNGGPRKLAALKVVVTIYRNAALVAQWGRLGEPKWTTPVKTAPKSTAPKTTGAAPKTTKTAPTGAAPAPKTRAPKTTAPTAPTTAPAAPKTARTARTTKTTK
jgi:hypothetical protein